MQAHATERAQTEDHIQHLQSAGVAASMPILPRQNEAPLMSMPPHLVLQARQGLCLLSFGELIDMT